MINILKRKEGMLQKVFFLSLVFLILLAMAAIILAADNETNTTTQTQNQTINASNINSENNTPIQVSNNESSNITITENSTDNNNNNNNNNITAVNNTNNTNSTNILSGNQNETSQTPEQTGTASNPEQNASGSQSLIPEFEINISVPENITRGESFEMKINITNIGAVEGKGITMHIILPNGFDSLNDESLGTIPIGGNVEITEKVTSHISAPTGLNEIKVALNY